LAIRVLVVDDFDPWRRFASAALQRQPDLQIVGEACDGSVAVQKAQQLQPELILLDIGLPGLNGIQASRRIRELSPKSKILFVTENQSPETARAAFRAGAHGYVVKSSAGSELLPGIRAVLRGELFASARLGLTGHGSSSELVFKTASADEPGGLMGSQLGLWDEERREITVNGRGEKS
jgi:DNA-binding NarL/FixJ family response regulator